MLVHLFSIFSLHTLLLQNRKAGVLRFKHQNATTGWSNRPQPHQIWLGAFLGCGAKLLWIICQCPPLDKCHMWNIAGGSWAAPMRRQAARKQPKALHVHHSVQPFFRIYLLSMQGLGPHTSARTKGVSEPFLKFNQKHTGVPFPLATPARSVWRSAEFHFVPGFSQTACPCSKQRESHFRPF